MSGYINANVMQKTMNGKNLLAIALYNYSRMPESSVIDKSIISSIVVEVKESQTPLENTVCSTLKDLLEKSLNEKKLFFSPKLITFTDLDIIYSSKKRAVYNNSYLPKMFDETKMKSEFLNLLNGEKKSLSSVAIRRAVTIDYALKGEMNQIIREFAEQEGISKVAEPVKPAPVLTIEQRLPTYLQVNYNEVMDIHTDGRVKEEAGHTVVSFGINLLKRDLKEGIYHNFKRIAGYECVKEDSNYAELKAVEMAIQEIQKNHSEFMNKETLFRFYIDNESVIKAIQIKKLWKNASERTYSIFKNMIDFLNEQNVSVIKVSSKENKGNKIAHMLAKKAVEMNKENASTVKVMDIFQDFTLKMENNFYNNRAKENYELLEKQLAG